MITGLKILFSILLIWVTYTVVTTSMQSNLFKEWDFLGTIPWMRATLWDFYTNALIIYLWICYKEKSVFAKVVWLILMFALGSIASCTYVLIQLFWLKPTEGIKEFLGNQNG
jgi:hypothetical protein